jgi:hypothetical protein
MTVLHQARVVRVSGVCYARWMCKLVVIAGALSLASCACGGTAAGTCRCGATTPSNHDPVPVAASNRDPVELASSDFFGTWNGDWGTLLLRRDRDRVLGAYTTVGGTIVGKIDDGILRGWWSEPPRTLPQYLGQVEFRLFRKDGVLHLDGRYRIGPSEDWNEDWDLRKLDGPPPPELEIEFTKPDNFVEGPR